MEVTLEIIGLLGALCFLAGFVQVSLGKWNGKSFWFEFLNVFGALLLGYYSFHKHAYTNIMLNVVWGGVALFGIFHITKRHKHRKAEYHTKKRTHGRVRR
jgi:hypothetical protein